jgi:hypothetical protein
MSRAHRRAADPPRRQPATKTSASRKLGRGAAGQTHAAAAGAEGIFSWSGPQRSSCALRTAISSLSAERPEKSQLHWQAQAPPGELVDHQPSPYASSVLAQDEA